MSDFKVGDKVVRIGNNCEDVRTGAEYTIRKITKYGSLDFEGLDNYGYTAKYFELAKPKFFDGYFKVRDKEHNKEIQEYLVSIGFLWFQDQTYVECNATYIFADTNGRITYLHAVNNIKDYVANIDNIPEYVLEAKKTYTLQKIEPVPKETIEIGGIRYLKEDVENALKGLKAQS